jgi:hypothetical protein
VARLLVFAAGLLGALALSGCGGGEAPSADEIVRGSVERTGAVRRFHFTLDIQNLPRSTTGLALQAAEGDIVVPDRLRANVTGTLAGISLTTELVVIAKTTYLKDPLSGAWRTIDVKTSPIAFFDPAQGVLSVIENVESVRRDGSEQVGGAETHRLVGRVPVRELSPLLGNPPGDELVDVTLWIGEEDLILRRIRVDGPIAEREPEDALRIVEVSRFDEPVTIEAPEGAG